MTFSEYLSEVKLSRQTNYTILPRKYVEAVNAILDSRKYEQMSTFNVDGTDYYCVLVMKDIFLEPHFGVFLPSKFDELQDAIKRNDSTKISELLKSDVFVRKNGYTNTGSNLTKIVSYVFSITADFLNKKPITDVKIMGNPRKFNVYRQFIKDNLGAIPYKILDDNMDAEYSDKDGNTLSAKAMHLKYNFA